MDVLKVKVKVYKKVETRNGVGKNNIPWSFSKQLCEVIGGDLYPNVAFDYQLDSSTPLPVGLYEFDLIPDSAVDKYNKSVVWNLSNPVLLQKK